VSSQLPVLDATSPAQLGALSHPTRHLILRELGPGAATISQLTRRLGVNKGNVAHHLAVLAEAGLVRKDRTRTVRGGTEQYWSRTAERIRFLAGDDGTATQAMLTSVTAEIGTDEAHLLNHRVLRLTEQQARALTRHLESVVDGLTTAADREQQYGVLVSVYRRA
jgi:DNA-binding transcriptional ArsR family regulator